MITDWSGNPTWEDLREAVALGTVHFTPQTVATWLGTDFTDEELDVMEQVVTAVTVTVTDWHGSPDSWSPRVILGSILLAAHLWRRRGTPGGVAGFTEEGVSYVQRHDPQAAMLLGLGGWTRPAVG